MDLDLWINAPNEYAEMTHDSIVAVLHPAIRKLVEYSHPRVVLDYGAGDGRLLQTLEFVNHRYAFDISPAMMSLAKTRLGSNLRAAYTNPDDIPNNYFDVVVCSLVLMMIPTESEYRTVVRALSRYAKLGGRIVIGITHPCFRSSIFSDFETEYSRGAPMEYLQEAQPFQVTIVDEPTAKELSIHDYHYTLTFTMNAIIDSGLQILQVRELGDRLSKSRSNAFTSPYLVIDSVKTSVER